MIFHAQKLLTCKTLVKDRTLKNKIDIRNTTTKTGHNTNDLLKLANYFFIPFHKSFILIFDVFYGLIFPLLKWYFMPLARFLSNGKKINVFEQVYPRHFIKRSKTPTRKRKAGLTQIREGSERTFG